MMLLTAQPGIELSRSTQIRSNEIFSANVYSVRGQIRRKRTEVAIAFDNKLELHDNATRLKEYSIPDQEAVICPPTSVKRKNSDGSTSRLSYLASHEAGKRCRIHGRIEDSKASLRLDKPLWTSSSIDVTVSSLEILTDLTGAVSLLVLFKDGQAKLLSENLAKEYWHTSTILDRGQEIQNIFTLDVAQAKTGILKSREDIVVKLDAMEAVKVLVIVATGNNAAAQDSAASVPQLIVIGVRPGTKDHSIGTTGPGLEVVLKHTIPECDGTSEVTANFNLHKPSGRLIKQGHADLVLYNIDGPGIKLDQTFSLPDPIESCVALSSTTLAFTTSQSIALLDAKHGSMKASTSFGGNSDDKQPAQGGTDAIRILTYLAPLSTIVVLKSRQVWYIKLSGQKGQQGTQKLLKENTLAAAIGHGLDMKVERSTSQHSDYIPPKFGSLVTSKARTAAWHDTKKQLHKAAKDNEVDAFDDIAIEHFGLRLSNGEAKAVRRDRKKIFAILNTLFKSSTPTHHRDDAQCTLKLKMTPPMTVGWLVHDGHFTQNKIESALKYSGNLSPTQSLKACTLIDAIHTHDPSLQTLIFLLSSSIHLTAPEIVVTILHTLQVLQQAHNKANQVKLLQSGAERPQSADVDMEDADAGGEPNKAPSASPSPEPESEKAHDAHALMRICLSRLAALSTADIQAAFKSALSQTSLIAFIDYLRLDLASGGWYSHHVFNDSGVDDTVSQPADHLRTVALLLSAAIDSLGSAGWLGVAGENNITARVAHMKAEISVALEGIEEAVYLQGVLDEVLMYAKHEPPPPSGSVMITGGAAKVELAKHDTLTAPDGTEMIKPITIGLGDDERNALPLGLRPVGTGKLENIHKVGVGGEAQKRSLRDIGQLKSMQVAAYSFERIMI